jgi:hypothetical protein
VLPAARMPCELTSTDICSAPERTGRDKPERSSPVTWCTTGDPSSLVGQAVMA